MKLCLRCIISFNELETFSIKAPDFKVLDGLLILFCTAPVVIRHKPHRQQLDQFQKTWFNNVLSTQQQFE